MSLSGEEWWRLLPPETSADAKRLLAARAVRAFADGFVSLLLPAYLLALGFSALGIGAIITATLIGSAGSTLLLGLVAHRFARRSLLLAACGLMLATGLGFAAVRDLWPLLVIGFLGTMNPSSGDVSVFLPLEHTALSQVARPARRTALFARYSLAGSLAGALGVLAAPVPDWLGIDRIAAMQGMFLLYGLLALAALAQYRHLSPAVEAPEAARQVRAALGPSRRIVYRLAMLFCIDSFGSGFFVQSILALWLFQAFDLSLGATASILFWAGLCSAVSYLLAVPLAARFGLVNTMVFTHLPSSLCVMALPFAPNLTVAIALLLFRAMLSQMDVPTRTSYVMAVVRPEERPAAAALTATARSLASALGPLLAGGLMSLSAFAWPLLIGGALKAAYDLLLLQQFRHVRPEEEA